MRIIRTGSPVFTLSQVTDLLTAGGSSLAAVSTQLRVNRDSNTGIAQKLSAEASTEEVQAKRAREIAVAQANENLRVNLETVAQKRTDAATAAQNAQSANALLALLPAQS
jgi:hypothetical protein